MLYLVWSIMIFMENVLSLTPTTKIMSIYRIENDHLGEWSLEKDWHFNKKILMMASAQVAETSVTKNSPSRDSNHPNDLFQSRKDNVSNIWNGHLPLYSLTWLNNTMIMCLVTSRSKFLYELWQVHQELGNRFITYIGMMKEKFWKTSQPNSFLEKSKK